MSQMEVGLAIGENGSWFGNRGEGIFVIDVVPLFEPFVNKASFMTVYSVINICLEFKNPFAIDDVEARPILNKSPCLVLL